jgi:adenylate kinase
MTDEICDYDGTKLQMRPDDSEDVVLERLTVHEKNTFPLTEYYRRKGQLREIDGNGAVDTVRTAIARVTSMLTI